MSKFQEIRTDGMTCNPFHMIGSQWMLVTAEKNGKINTMTASWGGLGVMWGKNVAYVVLRPQRYTKEFVDAADSFSLSFFTPEYKKTLGYLGTVSGRDEDKIAQSGLSCRMEEGVPCFEEAETILVCKKLFAQPYLQESFIDRGILEQWYPENDLHTFYIAEIVKILRKS